MDLKFNIDYRTRFGEELVLNLVNGDTEAKYRMMTTDGERWTYKLSLPSRGSRRVLAYYYGVERGGCAMSGQPCATHWNLQPFMVPIIRCSTVGTTSPKTLISTVRPLPTASAVVSPRR